MFKLVILTDPDSAAGLEVTGGDLTSSTESPGRLAVSWPQCPTDLISASSSAGSFSFWADEVSESHPVILPDLGVAISEGQDQRSLADLITDHVSAGRSTTLGRMAQEREDTYVAAAERNRQLKGPTWLGLGRDFRTFGCSFHGVGAGGGDERLWDWIAPQWHGEGVSLGSTKPIRYQFMIGRGVGPQHDICRNLADGILPILKARIDDGAISYHVTALVTLERSPLTVQANLGTPYLLADGHAVGHMFTTEQQQHFDELELGYDPTEETVFLLRIEAENTASVPRHAFVTLPAPYVAGSHEPVPSEHDAETGLSLLAIDECFVTATVAGQPAAMEELSPLVPPGQRVTIDIRVPHRPISHDRATALRDRPFEDAESQCKDYWRSRLAAGARIEVPEQRITDMVAAGLLHLDLVSYGAEPDGPLAPTIGVYAPIGSESAPIIQFYDSMGWGDSAERSLQYFVDKQHDDGFMQNFGGYMLETEAALWSLGEHFRYTRDLDWVKRIQPSVVSAVGYVLANRHRQQEAGLEPHGLIVGKTADPEDPYAAYMLNGYAYLGLSRAAEMVEQIDPALAHEWRAEAASLRRDIRDSFIDAIAGSPVVPLLDGTWCRTAPPWAGQAGPLAIDRSARRWHTHGTITARDAMLGPLWLAMQEVLEPHEAMTSELLEYHSDVMFHDNTAFSQPYYSPHLITHLRRGETAAFLHAYYTMMASLADPETYSFWEHYFHASPHKTHEEAWFLMQTRWMLWLEDGDAMRLLPGIPRRWLEDGQRISLVNVGTYFGLMSLDVASTGQQVVIRVNLDPDRAPRQVRVRLPHPHGPRSARVTAGNYDTSTETLVISAADCAGPVTVTFA